MRAASGRAAKAWPLVIARKSQRGIVTLPSLSPSRRCRHRWERAPS